MRELLAIIAVMFVGWGIIFKSDQQSVAVLEGRLHKLGKPMKQARIAYERHATRLSLILFTLGMGLMAVATILWVEHYIWPASICGVFAAALCGWSGWQRIRAFMAADAEISS